MNAPSYLYGMISLELKESCPAHAVCLTSGASELLKGPVIGMQLAGSLCTGVSPCPHHPSSEKGARLAFTRPQPPSLSQLKMHLITI